MALLDLPPHPTMETPDSEASWALVERVASSTPFRRATRLRDFLLYVGRCSLKEGRGKIHENEIGAAVFDRPPDYDTNIDPIVRVNATELRKRIEAYFDSEGSSETLVMEIPRGGYSPVFRLRPDPPQVTVDTPVPIASPEPRLLEAAPDPVRPRWMMSAFMVASVMLVLFAGCSLFYWSQYRNLYRSLYAWQDKPTVSSFWAQIFEANPDTDVVVADASIGLLQELSKKNFTLDDYLSHGYVGQLNADNQNPEIRAALSRIVAWNLQSQDDINLARRILALDPQGKSTHLYSARDYMPDLVKRDNVILIGGVLSNPWDELYESRMNFTATFNNNGPIAVKNRAPVAGEQPVYTQTDSAAYCVIAYLPKPDHNGVALVIEGTNAEASEAAGDFLLSEDALSSFKKMLHRQKLPYFEVMLKVSSVRSTPLTATIEAYRIYPDLH